MLRAFREAVDATPRLYQLVEVPTSIFDSIQGTSASEFDSDAPSIPCLVNGEVVAVVALDRSDAKNYCETHTNRRLHRSRGVETDVSRSTPEQASP